MAKVALTKWTGEALPEPRFVTPEQHKAVVSWMATMPLSELRHRQKLCEVQMQSCADNGKHEAHANQFTVWRQLAAAVGLQQCNLTE